MKPTNKKGYPFVVECENQDQTKYILNYYDNDNYPWAHWKYILIRGEKAKELHGTKKFLNFEDEFTFISFSEWLQLPDYEPEEIAFKETKKIIGYKLVKPEYEESAGRIVYGKLSEDNYKFIKHKDDIAFLFKSPAHERLEKAEVLDLWFEPVYEEPTKKEKLREYFKSRGIEYSEFDFENIINIVNEK